jgi:glycosyltransferase involved in cell wall biosynthesis
MEKILIVSHYGVGGSLVYLQHLTTALEKKGYPVTFWLSKDAGLKIKNNTACKYILKEPSTYPAFLKIRFFKYLYHLSKYLYNAVIIKPEKNIKVVHLLFPFYLTDLITTSRLKRKGVKVILTVHEIFPHKPFLGGKTDMKIIKKMYKNSDLLLVHSDSLKNELLDLFSLPPDKIRVIPHGYFELPLSFVDVITLRRKYHVPFDKKILLFFGTIRENKGLDILLNVMKDIKKDFFLLIAGQIAGASEPSADYYKEIIKANNISDSVCWVERYITEEETAEVFKISHTVVLPYKKSFHAQSGVLNLAIGYEKPCVVSDVGGIGETVREYNIGIVVTPEDVHDLQRGIRNIFQDNIKFGFDQYKYDNNWDKVCDKLISAYEELIEK